MNYQFLRTVIGGTWHVNAQTYFELMPIRNMILTGMQFEDAEPDASSLPYFVNAEDNYHYSLQTVPKSGQYVFVTVISGAMTRHDQACGGIGTNRQMSIMSKYDKLPSTVGHILYLDSGGGQTISLDPFKEAFAEFSKPVVAYVENMAASAAMGAASFADEIYASKPKAVLGSIGTMIAFDGHPANTTSPDGIHHVRLYASRSVKKNGDFEAALKGDYKPIIENTLNPVNNDFIALIQANRPAITDEYCDGQDYYAEDVIGTLIDGVMPFEQVVNRVIELSNNANSNNTNNSQNNKMANTNMNVLAGVAGFKSLEVDNKGFVSLPQANAQVVNNELTKIREAAKAKATAEAALTAANKTIAEQEATIENLKKENEKLSGEPGADSAQAFTDSDDPGKGDPLAQFSVDTDSSLEDILNAFENYK